MPLIRSISGLRATLSDQSLNEITVKLYARSFAEFCNFGTIIVGRDGRPSGEHIEAILAEELSKFGCQVVLVGVVPTPTLQLEAEHSDAAGGIAITASHNPADWNGLKFINSDGVFLDADENRKFWEIVDNDKAICNGQKGSIRYDEEAISRHIDKILNLNFIKDNYSKIFNRKFKVAVDAVNASGSHAVPLILEKLGCEVFPLYCTGSGEFPHEPEPLPKNLTELAEFASANNCDFAVAVDPDADRLVLVEVQSKYINEELTLPLCVDSLLSSSQLGNVVVNLSTSKMTEDIANKYNCKTFRAAVGEINVVKKMKAENAVVGGEGSGGIILPECHFGRDSLVGIALFVNLLAIKNKSFKELLATYPKYAMIKYKQTFSGDFDEISKRLSIAFSDAKLSTEDGLRFDYESSWIQIRKSNTEPIIRIIAESPSEYESISLIEKAKSLTGD